MRRFALVPCLCAITLAAAAAYQVRFVPVRVAPIYEAGDHRADRPRVVTNSGFDRLLASSRPEEIARVAEAVRADPDGVTPITMMVLAIRSYDVGKRDESVFWFYAARDRMATASAVLDMGYAEVQRIGAATRAFALRAGPTINGYALCDVDRYRRIRREALDWVEKNPYATIFVQAIPSHPGDRREHLARSLRELRAEVEEEAAALSSPEGRAKLAVARRETEADAKYCWK